jgi:hypothetical protein
MRDTEEPVMLCEASDLSSFGFFQRPTCHQLLNAFSKIVVKRIQPGQRITVGNAMPAHLCSMFLFVIVLFCQLIV